MPKINASKLAKECPEDFPYRIALITRESHNVILLPSYDMFSNNDDDSNILIFCTGLVSILNKTGKIMKYKKWSYDIYVVESNLTLIEVHVLPGTKGKPIKISSETYPTSEVFKFFPSLNKRNKAGKNISPGEKKI